jgi:hypothetical protein
VELVTRFLTVILLVLLILLIVNNYKLPKNLYDLWTIERTIATWDSNGFVDQQMELQKGLRTVRSINKNRFIRSRVTEVEIKLLEWLAHIQKLSPREQIKTFQRIQRLAQTQIIEEPISGKKWARLFYIHGYLHKEWSEREELMLRKSLAYGKWDGAVQQYIIKGTFNRWNKFPANLKDELLLLSSKIAGRGGDPSRLLDSFCRNNPEHPFAKQFIDLVRN